jgi:hypothetical protein
VLGADYGCGAAKGVVNSVILKSATRKRTDRARRRA